MLARTLRGRKLQRRKRESLRSSSSRTCMRRVRVSARLWERTRAKTCWSTSSSGSVSGSERDLSMTFDVVVIGAGHAGVEAAYAAARMGCHVGLCTLSLETVAHMPCNPAIGGTAKGHLVREIDALGGLMGRAIDATGIQFKLLNRSRGPAVWSPRAQADKKRYADWVRTSLGQEPNIEWIPGRAGRILATAGQINGLALETGERLLCSS